MKQSHLLLFFLSLLLNLSFQTQLIRDFAGATVQNLQAQASQWTLSDPSGAEYEIGVFDCLPDRIIVKPDSLPTGTTLKKTFDGLEDHSFLRFYVQMYYIGDFTSQTVMIKFDDVSIEMSKINPESYPPPDYSCSPLALHDYIVYYGAVPHSDASVTVEFSSNLNGAGTEISWGLRNFSLITDNSDPVSSAEISAVSYSQLTTVPYSRCPSNTYLDGPICSVCSYPCQECYGPGSDKCFIYLPESTENHLCPDGQTFLTLGCTNCVLENCNVCDQDVNKCDTCLTTCAQCDNGASPPQCQLCTFESNLVLYEGSCIDSCPQGTYADYDRICQPCQPGCLDCTGLGQCSQCDTSETTNIDGYCICPQPGTYFEESSGACTGTCLLGCEQCVSSDACLTCASGTTVQPNGDCRCDTNGFYYQEETGSCTGQCYEYCDYCHDATSCLSCSGNRVPEGGLCKCSSPRVLIGTSCECPSFMSPNPFFSNCEYSTDTGFTVQSTISPLFDAILILNTNPYSKWTSMSYKWMVSCPFQNQDTQNQFQSYMSSQNTNALLIPSSFLEYDLRCTVQASVFSGMVILILQGPSFKTVSPAYPQVNIVGGPFQMLNPAKLNFILAQVQSSVGKPLSASGLNITWTQTSGDSLDMSSILNPSDPFKLTIPKCMLSKGKLYSFKLTVQFIINPGAQVSQEITIGAYAPKFQAQIIGLENMNYHLLSKSLTLESQLSFLQDNECPQTDSLSDLLDLSTAMYTWECVAIDLQLSSSTRLLDELSDITDDSNVLVHPDPQQIFYHSTSSSSLTIPSSYFTDYSGYQFIFYLTVTIQSKVIETSVTSFKLQRPRLEILKNKTSLHIVTSKPFTTPSFTCVSENNCQAFSQDFPTKFIGSSFNSKYSYNWLLNTLDPRQYNTFLTLSNKETDDMTIVPRILYTISDGTNVASAFMTLPWNTPPKDGNLGIYPTEGQAYNTKFFLYAYGWTDADLPLSYEFFTTYVPVTVVPVRNKLFKTFSPDGYTPLIPEPNLTYSYLGVIVQDNLKSTTLSAPAVIFLSGGAHSFCEAVDKSSQALTQSMVSDSLLDRFRLISVILENLQKWEKALDSACVNADSEFKFTAVTELKEIVQNLNSKEEFKAQVLQNLVWSAYPEANQDRNFELYINMVDSYYQPDSSPILSTEEYKSMLTFIDYIIWYMKKPGTSIEDPDKIFTYINMVLRSTLSEKTLPTDNEVAYQGEFYTYFTTKTTYCKVLQGVTILTNGLENNMQANVTLRPNQEIPPEKCNNQINMVYLAFKSNYTLKTDGFTKNIVYFDLIDSLTGKSVLDIFTFALISPILICPIDYVCVPNGGGTEIYGLFDLKDQINKIFAKSNIGQIQNISVLAHFQFWKSVAFWTVVGFSAWFLLSFYWLYVKHPTYCALTAKKHTIGKATLLKKIHLFFWVIHPLVGIYVYNDMKTSKPIKLAIYYQRLVIVMVFSTIFSSLDTGEGWVFKGYILLFNAVTVPPVNALLSRIFEWAFKTDKKKKISSKIKLYSGTVFYLALLVACFLVMFIIEAQQDASQNKTWAFNFVIAFVQDLSLSPAISALNKVLFIKFSTKNKLAKKMKSEKIQRLILSKDFKSIYETIFETTTTLTTKESLQSQRITTLAPTSPNARLIKFTTLDMQPPLSAKSSTNREFRSRVASETEINSVDFAAAETEINNQLQALFSEAKPETVRQASPTKQNFQILQTLKSSLANKTSPSKPFTTVEFNIKEPVEMSLDDIFRFAEQPDGEEDHPSQLKLTKDINTMSSPIRDKKQKISLSPYYPSVELSLEQRISEKTNRAVQKKSILKHSGATLRPSQLMDLSSMNQFKEQSGLHPEEFSSFDGNAEETFASQPKLWKNGKTMEAPIRQKKKDLRINQKLTSDDNQSGALTSTQTQKAKRRDPFKYNESMINKLSPSMEVSSMFHFKEPSGIHPEEFSSFDGHAEDTFVAQSKMLKNGKMIESSIFKEKNKNKKESPEKIKHEK